MGDDDEVVVFMVSAHTNTNYRRVLWRVSRRDAKTICGDPRTATARHMLCWAADNIDDPNFNRYVPDNGMYAAVLAGHGVTVLPAAA